MLIENKELDIIWTRAICNTKRLTEIYLRHKFKASFIIATIANFQIHSENISKSRKLNHGTCDNRRVNIYTNVYLSNTIHPDSHGCVICIVFTAILVTDRLLDASSSLADQLYYRLLITL